MGLKQDIDSGRLVCLAGKIFIQTLIGSQALVDKS
jgi:hypothetical protein